MSVKKNICVLCAVLLIADGFSEQTVSSGSQIELDDAATVISETGVVPEKEAIPDFSLILPLETDSLPVLADANISADALIQSEAPGSEDASSQDVFLEGAIGAGWPGFFSGDFSVYRNIGAEPFKLEFFHESVTGIGRHSAVDGYESQNTRLSGEKQFAFGEALLLDAAAGYETRTDGLQGKKSGFFDISRQNITGSAIINWKPGDMLTVKGAADGVFNTQFMSSSTPTEPVTFFGAGTSVQAVLEKDNWDGLVSLSYDFGMEQSRFEAGAAVSFGILDYADVSLSASALLAKQASEDVLIPFAVNISTGSGASFYGMLSGGLKSAAITPVSLQKETPFLMSGTTPAETTEWFFDAAADIPFYDIGVLNISADFATTAYDGKRMLLDRSSLDSSTGLANVSNTDVTVLDSRFGVTIPMKIFNASFGWNASWLDATRYDRTRDSSSALTLDVSFADESNVWSAGAGILWPANRTPEIGFNGCFQATKSVRFELEFNDIVNMISGEDRLICDTYAERSGYAALFVKVNF